MTAEQLNASCFVCGQPARRNHTLSRTRCDGCVGIRAAAATEGSIHPGLPFEQDEAAQRFVAEHPDGATLEEVGNAFGLTRERMRQIEAKAIDALRKRCALAGIEAEDLAAALARRDEVSPRGPRLTAATRPAPEAEPVERNTVPHHLRPLPEELYSDEGQRLARAVLVLEVEAEIAARAAELCAAGDDEPRVAWTQEEQAPASSIRIDADRPESRAAAHEEEGTVEEPKKRDVLLLEWQGEKRSAYDWVRDPRVSRLGISGPGIVFRIQRGWTAEEALTTPKGETPERILAEGQGRAAAITHDGRTMTVVAWAEELGIRTKTIRERMRRHPDAGPAVWFGRVLSPTEAGIRGGRPPGGGSHARPRAALPSPTLADGLPARPAAAPSAPPQDARERLRTAETIPAPSAPASVPQSALRVLEQVGLVVERLLDAPRGPVVLVVDGGSSVDVGRLLAEIGCDFEEVGRGPRGVVLLVPTEGRDRQAIEGAGA